MGYGSRRPPTIVRGRRGRALPLPAAPDRQRSRVASRPLKLALAVALVSVGSTTSLGEGLLNAGVAAAREAVQLMDERTPGLRTAASMTKGKPRIAVDRVARALPRIRDARSSTRPPIAAQALPGAVASPVAEALPGVVAPGGAAPVFAEAPGGAFVGGPGGVAGVIFPPFTGIGIGGGGGGVIIGPGPETPPETPITPPAAPPPVPEPATWAMMILGFGLAGAGARAQRRRTPAHA